MAAARVLVVEDEQICLEVTRRRLIREGYQVFPASGPRQALEIVKNNPPMDVVVSDIHMPDMRGTELVRDIERISPRTAAVFMTAFAGSRGVPKGVPLLRKPFSVADLIAAVEAGLERNCKKSRKLRVRSRQLGSELETATSQLAQTVHELRTEIASRNRKPVSHCPTGTE